MSDEIEMLPLQWTSAAAQDLFDHIYEQISRAFVVPRHLLSAGPRLAATEDLRRAAARLYAKHTMVGWLAR